MPRVDEVPLEDRSEDVKSPLPSSSPSPSSSAAIGGLPVTLPKVAGLLDFHELGELGEVGELRRSGSLEVSGSGKRESPPPEAGVDVGVETPAPAAPAGAVALLALLGAVTPFSPLVTVIELALPLLHIPLFIL